MAKTEAIQRPEPGTELFEADKVFEDIKAKDGRVRLHVHAYRPVRGFGRPGEPVDDHARAAQGLSTNLVLYGPGVLMASATRGFPKVGDEAFPGHMAINNQIKKFLDEGGKVYACRFAAGALYGLPSELPARRRSPVPPARRARFGADRLARSGVPAEHLDALT